MTASNAIHWARRVRSERPPAAVDEYLAGPLARWMATRIFAVLEKAA